MCFILKTLVQWFVCTPSESQYLIILLFLSKKTIFRRFLLCNLSNTEKRVKITTDSGVFLTNFEVFENLLNG